MLKIYDGGGKLLNGIKSMYVSILVCVRIKGGESEGFRIDIGVRQDQIISHWLLNVHMDAVMKVLKMQIRRMGGNRDYLCKVMVLNGEEGL